jgi:ankyrin repeat protein
MGNESWKGNAVSRVASLLLLLSAVGCAGTLPKPDRDLFAAIKRGDAGEVDRLLASGANVNGVDAHATTPLHVAAYHEDPAVAALLVRNGAAVNVRNDAGMTPLHKAMERLAFAPATRKAPEEEVAKVTRVVELLLASGAQVDAGASGGAMPIHTAALTGQTALVQLLIDKGAAVDARTADGVTPLYQATKKDAAEVVRLLIARGADVNAQTKSGYTALKMAGEHGSAEVAKLLLARGAAVDARDKEGFTPLLSACRSLLIRYTIEASTPGADDLRRKRSAGELAELREALASVKGDFSEVALLLVNGGADPNVAAPGFAPLGTAAIVGDVALAAALIAHGAAIDGTGAGESPLHAAIAEGHAELAKLLIDKGANVNARNMSQLTPLHFVATYMHDRALAELLIRHGGDVSAKDRDGRTPLELAIRARNEEVAGVLRQHGAQHGAK